MSEIKEGLLQRVLDIANGPGSRYQKVSDILETVRRHGHPDINRQTAEELYVACLRRFREGDGKSDHLSATQRMARRRRRR